MAENYAIELQGITKTFGSVVANNGINLNVRPGEILALLGENGSGKTTLMNMLSGIYKPDSGQIFVDGKEVSIDSPEDSKRLGIGMVHQHFKLVDVFSAADNIWMGKEKPGLMLKKERYAQIEEMAKKFGFDIDPKKKVYNMAVSEKQTLEIIKVLYYGAKIIILDEPTAVLTPQETDELFAILRRVVKEKGMTVIIITHKLYEVMAISDRVGVMRQGKLIGIEETKNVNERILASMMVGREGLQEPVEKPDTAGEVKISVSDLHVPDNRGLPAVKGLSLEVRAGEILGIAAIEGNGQSELLEAITGMRPYSGLITVGGQDIRGLNPGQIRNLGLSHVPEDRLATGVSAQADIADNLLMGKHKTKEFTKFRFHQNKKAVRDYASRIFEKFDVRAPGVDTKVGSLSGGNMQKVVIAREFSFNSQVYIISQPTRGVDIGAIEFIHNRILEKKQEGAAILLCSADLDEVLRLSDRVITIYEGQITGEFDKNHLEKTEIGYYMTGSREEVHQ